MEEIEIANETANGTAIETATERDMAAVADVTMMGQGKDTMRVTGMMTLEASEDTDPVGTALSTQSIRRSWWVSAF